MEQQQNKGIEAEIELQLEKKDWHKPQFHKLSVTVATGYN